MTQPRRGTAGQEEEVAQVRLRRHGLRSQACQTEQSAGGCADRRSVIVISISLRFGFHFFINS